jgi:hypothetical protein
MSREIIFVVEESPEVPFLPGVNALDEICQAVNDGVACHFEEGLMPDIIRTNNQKRKLNNGKTGE